MSRVCACVRAFARGGRGGERASKAGRVTGKGSSNRDHQKRGMEAYSCVRVCICAHVGVGTGVCACVRSFVCAYVRVCVRQVDFSEMSVEEDSMFAHKESDPLVARRALVSPLGGKNQPKF